MIPLPVAADDGRGRCKGRLRTGSGPRGSSPKQIRLCAVVPPVVFRRDGFFLRGIYFPPLICLSSAYTYRIDIASIGSRVGL
jgi:hypothetical protein